MIADIYRRADAAADAHSPWLFWLTPEGHIVPLFDVLQPVPSPAQLPPDFVALAEGGRSRFQN